MKIFIQNPPNHDQLVKFFNLDENEIIFFSYGDCLYNPKGVTMSADLIRHEETHLYQQGYDRTSAKIWWDMYITDAYFRSEQEIEAYGEQYKFICQIYKDRNKRDTYLRGFSKYLSSTMYGNCIKYNEAYKRIKNYASGKDMESIEDHIKEEPSIE